MLIAHVERYISLRQTLGYKLRDVSANLRGFAKFADERGDTCVRVSTALDWATGASSPHVRHVRMRNVARFAHFLQAEDPTHEVPSNPFLASKYRRLPYIYEPDEIVQLIRAASRLRKSYPLRCQIYGTLLGLIAATGLRISEALDLRLSDVLHDPRQLDLPAYCLTDECYPACLVLPHRKRLLQLHRLASPETLTPTSPPRESSLPLHFSLRELGRSRLPGSPSIRRSTVSPARCATVARGVAGYAAVRRWDRRPGIAHTASALESWQ